MSALARNTDPHTSHEAAQSIDPARQRAQVLDELRKWNGGLTDEELCTWMPGNHSPSGVRTRRCELTRMGLVVDTGERRKTRSGRSAIVWAVTS